MIGLRNAVATAVKMTRPLWAPTDEDMMEIFVSPGLVQWDYIPYDSGTFRIFRGLCGDGVLFEAFGTTDVGELFMHFLRDNLPRSGQWCIVLDDKGKCIMGWVADSEGTIWTGCEYVFRVLERIHEPVDVALWEQNARANYEMERTLRGSTRATE